MEQLDRSAMTRLILDLQTNIQGIMIGIDKVADLIYEQGSGSEQENLCMMERKLFQLLRTVRHMNILAGESWFLPQEGDIVRLCEDLVFESNSLTRMMGITTTFECGERVPHAKYDAELIKNALLNLISNSVSACQPGGHIVLRVEAMDDLVSIRVTDDGSGFTAPSNDNPLLSAPGQGSGLGLPVVRHIAEMHNGSFLLESRPDKGTTAVLTLPAAKVQHSVLATPTLGGMQYDLSGGFSPALVELAPLLPNGCFDPQTLM